MLIFATSPLSCRVGWRRDLGCDLGPAGDLCAFEFPQCRGCHKAPEQPRTEPGDPMDSVIWRGWIDGFAQTEREPDALATMLLDAPAHFPTLSKTIETSRNDRMIAGDRKIADDALRVLHGARSLPTAEAVDALRPFLMLFVRARAAIASSMLRRRRSASWWIAWMSGRRRPTMSGRTRSRRPSAWPMRQTDCGPRGGRSPPKSLL